jgi:pyruvate/2-oxoglutarate dehydrogenase complex dihydrolipoamide dehydrogenase (E3) component
MSTERFELAVIGEEAGKTLTVKTAMAVRKAALIERGTIGGGCITVACIPTKTESL